MTNYLRVSALLLAMVAAALVAVLVSYNNPASAQSTTAVAGTTIKVNTKADESNTDGDCSLREAIQAANANAPVDGCKAGSDTEEDAIHFALGKKAAIVLGSTLPEITDASGLTIDGQKAKSTISGNDQVRVFQVGSGAEVNLARLTVADGRADIGAGGGILSLDGTLTVIDSTFSGNSARSGGGIFNNGGTLEVTNSTFSGNSAVFRGGGIDNFGTATLRNTIMANSPSGGNCSGTGTLTDGGYNIDDETTCGFSEATSRSDTDPLLNPKGLKNNGGPTQTIQLLKGSPAVSVIPKGTNGCGTEIEEDQRGVNRPKGPGCDIGAFEKKRHVQPTL